MYRSLGKLSSFGVPSGPYSGRPRRLVWRLLPPDVKRRLVATLEGHGRPAPIAIDVPRRSLLAKRLVLAALGGTVLLVALVVASWPRAQAPAFAPLYALAMLPVVLLGALLAHRRVVRGGAPLDPGKVLFPLDLLAFDGSVITLTPLGAVRDVGIEGDATAAKDPLRLVLRFEDGAEATFPMPSATHADRTFDALVEAQKTLEVLSYGEDLERALDHDPFFAARVGGELDACAAPEKSGRPLPLAVFFAVAGLVALALGQVAFVATNRFSDEMRFQRAFASDREEAMVDYLDRGGLRVTEARYFLANRRLERRRIADVDRMRERVARNEAMLAALVAPGPKNPPGFVLPRTPAQWNVAHADCLRALATRAPTPSKIMPSLTALVDEARRGQGGPARLPIRFTRTFAATEDASGQVVAALDAREREVRRAIRVVMAEVCPPAVLDLSTEASPSEDGPALRVRYAVKKAVPRPLGEVSLALSEIRFDVTLEVWPKKPVGFSLTMPAPEVAPTDVRERSVFRLDDGAAPSARVYGAWTARAFDRLYDEIYGLFFAGAVKVPLPGFAEVERIFMK